MIYVQNGLYNFFLPNVEIKSVIFDDYIIKQ